MSTNKKTFAIVSLGFLGDTLLVEPLCRNLRNNYPDSKIIVITNNVFKELPQGFDSVDEIFGYDKKNKHKGNLGYFKFAKEFPYKGKIDHAIITHPHERSILISKFIGAKNIISLKRKSLFNFLVNTKIEYIEEEIRNTYKADYFLKLIKSLCNPKPYYVEYKRTDINEKEIINKFNLPDKYIVLSPTSKDLIKDWDYNHVKTFIEEIKTPVVIIGKEKAKEISDKLKSEKINFIDLTNKTTITELGAVIKNASYCISVDTGTLHFSYAQGVKTIGLFFNPKFVKEWAPNNLACLTILKGEKILQSDTIICKKDIDAFDVLELIESLNVKR